MSLDRPKDTDASFGHPMYCVSGIFERQCPGFDQGFSAIGITRHALAACKKIRFRSVPKMQFAHGVCLNALQSRVN